MFARSAVVAVLGGLVFTLLAVVGGGPASTTPAADRAAVQAPAPLEPRPITWRRCSGDLGARGAQCGRLVVPLDWSKPNGRKISLAVSRVLHTRGEGRGAVFTNPGGPGGSGLFFSVLGEFVPDRVGLSYDWYGMDPRGVGDSRPALSCSTRYFPWDRPRYEPSTKKIARYWRRASAAYARACGNSPARELIGHVTTIDNVRDFDALRRAIGEEQITFYGFSYGTYIAQVYATLFPDSLKALILDGVVDPNRAFYQSNLDQNRAFEVVAGKFFAWVARHRATYRLGATGAAVERTYYRTLRRLDRRALDGKVGPSELNDFLVAAGYYAGSWPSVAQGLSDVVRRDDATAVKESYRASNPQTKGGDNGFAMYLATQCSDAPWPRSAARIRRDNVRVDREAPFLTWNNAQFNAPCRTFPGGVGGPRVDIDGRTFDGPVLLLSETLDAATPFAGALRVRRLFPAARLVAGKGGTSHSVSLSGIACTDDTIANLLRDGSLPARRSGSRADKVCRPFRAPEPDAAARTARTAPQRPLVVVR